MTNDERDVLHHISAAQDTAPQGEGQTWILCTLCYHVGAAIALAVLEVARAIREAKS